MPTLIAASSDNNSTNNDIIPKYEYLIEPIMDMVKDFQDDPNTLAKFKEHLVELIIFNIKWNKSVDSQSVEVNNIYLNPQNFDDARKRYGNFPMKFINKLKRDINEVINDVAIIQRIIPSHNISHNMKVLIRSLQYYIRNEKKFEKLNKTRRYNSQISKLHEKSGIMNNDSVKFIKDILTVLD